MTPSDLAQIEQLLDKKFSEFREEIESIVGDNGEKILDAMNVATVSKTDFDNLENRVTKLENDLQTA